MNNHQQIQQMSPDQLARFLDENCGGCDRAVWDKWFDTTYCAKCAAVVCKNEFSDQDQEFSYCELNGYCRYFEQLGHFPTILDVINLWLNFDVN